MTFKNQHLKTSFAVIAGAAILGISQMSAACGGFFCDFAPIDQAGEQIIFRQEGGETTAMIKIDYAGSAEDFGWVLPVPQTPEISLGSDQIFTDLEINTRPQFLLERVGSGCEFIGIDGGGGGNFGGVPTASPVADEKTGVVVEQTLSVGPFDALVISSDNPTDLAEWLADNNLDLTDQGDELLKPYIDAQSKFVVLKLKSNAETGSIQPIILKYASNTPVIPMTLTAVAAQDDMGVLVWLLGAGRGVPSNFNHVTPNYTRLNWFNGSRAAYASYQTLITDAMDETDSGQGFATDFAGYMPNLVEQLTKSDQWVEMLARNEGLSDAAFISELWSSLSPVVQSTIRAALPTSDAFVYSRPLSMEEVFSAEQLASARVEVKKVVDEQVIAPLDNSLDILDDNLYLTRLYTTLSADEMTQNPQFTFNTQMGDQPLTRRATLTAACKNEQTEWTLKLGEGTGRDDEVVIEGWQPVPFGPIAVEQDARWRVEKTSANSDPELLEERPFTVLTLGERPQAQPSGSGGSGGGSTHWLWLSVLASIILVARRAQGAFAKK